MEQHDGMKEYASLYKANSEQLSKTIRSKYWNNERKIFADTPEKDQFSQHTNSLAILAGLLKGEEAENLGRTLLTDTTLVQASIYFKFYLHMALVEAGLGDEYLNWLNVWRKNMELGLTTWAETSQVEMTRSDCHAWGSSPNVEFFRTLLGIDSSAPNFKVVKIEPHLGSIKKIGGEIPHPEGKISVTYDRTGQTLNAVIVLPGKVTGTFIWKGKNYPLKAGENQLNL
jgi:hypothetical protein